MSNLNEIKKNYSVFTTDKLLNIAKEIDGLKPEAIVLLQEELIKRNELEEASKITKHLINQKNEQELRDNFDPENYIKKELEAGESIENIKFKLNTMGIDMFDVIKKEQSQENIIVNYIESKKLEGESKETIDNDLKENFNVDSNYLNEVKNKLREKGKKNITIGIVLLVVSILINIFLLTKGSISIPAILLFGLGVWKLVKGEHQLRKN
ncbi:MAG: hypothetical protein ABJD66_11890 [Cellulophaga sp.]|uniref:hypothetical protein n=1 Tax=Cellulophaga sp. TaxID=1972202 RepID=UPI0032675C48